MYNPNVADSLRDGKELWPGYTLDFVAYYPYQKGFKYDGETYNAADYKDDLYGWVWSPDRTGLCMHPVPRNEMYLYYKVPESIDKQVDFMAEYIQNQDHGTCELKLKHLLTAIRFETGEKMGPCTIKKIAISGVRGAGYMDLSKMLNDDRGEWWEKAEKDETGTEAETAAESGTGTETGTDKENDFIKYLDLKKGSSKRATYTISYGDDGREFKADPDDPDGYTPAGKSLLGDESEADNKNTAFFLMPQELDERATLYIELEYEGQSILDKGEPKKYTIKRNIDLKPKGEDRTWTPGTTIIYTLSGRMPELVADLYLTGEDNKPLKEINVGYAGGETNYKVGSYIYYDNNGTKTKYPMPWKASIVTLDYSKLDENGNPEENIIISYKLPPNTVGVVDVNKVEKEIKDQGAYDKEFGTIDRIEFDYYGDNNPAKLADMKDNPVKTFVMIPKIVMKKTSSATAALRSAVPPAGNSETAPFNLASRGIGLAKDGLEIFHKNGMDNNGTDDWTNNLRREYTYTTDDPSGNDINTANCYIVSAPGWYSFPLVYGNAIKDGCVNYSAYICKSDNHGKSKSTSTSLNGQNQILKNAINHAGNPIQSPYILYGNGIGSDNLEAELLWEDQVCLIEDVSLVDTGDQTQTLDEFYSMPPSLRTVTHTYTPKKKIKFQIRAGNIRQGNAVIVLKEKDTTDDNGDVKKGDVIWSWHIWVTPDGTGTASNYHPISHESTIYGRYYAEEGVRKSWTDKHNHYIYNRCIGMVMAGDKYDFTPPNVYIKYEPNYDALEKLLTNSKGKYIADYKFPKMTPGPTGTARAYRNKIEDYFKKHPVYVKVNQADLSCEVTEDYYMLYQWGRKDPMISRFENIYDGDHCLIEPTDKRHLGEHSDITTHKDWIMYGIKHPEECMYNGKGITSGNFYANLWNFSLGTVEINSIYPGPTDDLYELADFYNGDWWMNPAKYILTGFYFTSDRVFKSVYDPSPVGQKMPVGPVINFLSTDEENHVTKDAGENGTWYHYTFETFTDYDHTATGMGGLFTECMKGPDGKYTNEPDPSSSHSFWIPAFGYRFGDGITKKHNLEFAIWEGGALSSAGKGRVLHGNSSRVLVWGGDNNSPFIYTMSLPVLPIFEEPQWLRTF